MPNLATTSFPSGCRRMSGEFPLEPSKEVCAMPPTPKVLSNMPCGSYRATVFPAPVTTISPSGCNIAASGVDKEVATTPPLPKDESSVPS